MFKNKTIIVPLMFVLLLAGGAYFFLSNKSSQKQSVTGQSQAQDEIIPSISVSDLGLNTQIRDDNRAVKFEVTNTKDIESIDYQISYTKEVAGESVPEGLIGTVKPDTNGDLAIKYREFGTCSSGKCRYDNVVSAIRLTLKITKSDGKVYQAETTVEVPGVSDKVTSIPASEKTVQPE